MKEGQDNIEKFFNKYLADGDFEFDEGQWQDLEERLDQMDGSGAAAPSPAGITRKGRMAKLGSVLFIISLATLTFFLGWYIKGNESALPRDASTEGVASSPTDMYDQGQRVEPGPKSADAGICEEELVAGENQTAGRKPASEGMDDHADREQGYDQEPHGEEGQNNRYLIQTETYSSRNNATASRGDQAMAQGEFEREPSMADEEEVTTGPISLENEAVTYAASHKAIGMDDNHESIANASNQTQKSGILLEELARVPLGLAFLDKAETLNIALVEVARIIQDDSAIIIPDLPNKGWAITGFVAPDFNSTNLTDLYQSLGQSVGVAAEYYPNSKFRMGMAAILNNKVYTAGEGDYTPEQGFWTNGIAPESTDAKCLALDIPITVGYRVFGDSKNSFWVNAGVSSYWLLNENYQYKYASQDPTLVQQWSGQRENFNMFGALNLSVSYERQLNNHLSLFVEPYFKTPLRGIGHGSVNLLSSGVNVGFKYRFAPIINAISP